jgi:hypothetical protein
MRYYYECFVCLYEDVMNEEECKACKRRVKNRDRQITLGL